MRFSSEGHLNLPVWRQKRSVTLEEIAEKTKISMRFLRAIEDGEYEKLPGGIFATSYLRQYAASVGFEEAELLRHYQNAMNPSAAQRNGESEEDHRGILERWLRVPAPLQRP
ncbi:MAG TPA: helix-turn-helix transcriptional regulator [Bryobacteraceae bacterium]|nr:helix-turn-helix transcriptional regulator [Bryobacteraceae bacterium]